MSKKIDLGISLYGFTERFIKEDDYGFEEMFKDLKSLGIKKFEIVGAQMFDQYPSPRDEEIQEVVELAKKYDAEPFSYGAYIDYGKRSDRDLTDAEQLNEVTLELITAYKLGCKFMRCDIPLGIAEEIAKMAERYQIVVCKEIHAPELPSDPHIQELAKKFEEIGSDWIGFVPDFGCFIERPNQLHIDRFLGLGAKMETLQFIIDNRWNDYTEESMTAKIEEMRGGEAEKMAISEWFGYLSFAPADIEGFKSILPYSRYFHGKYYHIGEDCVETTIPYETLIGLISESGFEGTLIIEYEGHSFYRNDALEQLERHIEMENNIFNKLKSS